MPPWSPHIRVFTNHPDRERFPDHLFSSGADSWERYHVNSGGHTGCRDAYNSFVSAAKDYDIVVWTHADFFFFDYRRVRGMLEKLWADQAAFLCLGPTHRPNPRRPKEGVVPHIHNDFFAMPASFYRTVFPRYELCDGWLPDGTITDCIEVALGKWVWEKLNQHHTTAIQNVDCDIVNQPALEGFIGDEGPVGTRADSFKRAMRDLRVHAPASYDWLIEQALAENSWDDVRSETDGIPEVPDFIKDPRAR